MWWGGFWLCGFFPSSKSRFLDAMCVCMGFPLLWSALVWVLSEVSKDELWLHQWLRSEHGAGAGSSMGAACGSQVGRRHGMRFETSLASSSWATVFLIIAACDVLEHLMGPPVRG